MDTWLASAWLADSSAETLALRAKQRTVTRLNRRTLVFLVGGLSAAILAATLWALQPHRRIVEDLTELYNVESIQIRRTRCPASGLFEAADE